jgi:ferredoxin
MIQKCKTCKRIINGGSGRPNKSGYCSACLTRLRDEQRVRKRRRKHE